MLEWNLYLLRAFLTGSETFVKSGLIIWEFSLISKVEIASLKKLFISSAISLSFYSNLSPSTSFTLPRWLLLLEKTELTVRFSNVFRGQRKGALGTNWLTVFENNLLSGAKKYN